MGSGGSVRESPAHLLQQLQQRAKRRFGQHFLVSEHVVRQTVAAAHLAQGGRVVEIGPGLGALTEYLREQPIELICVELDEDIVQFWQNRAPELNIVHADALQVEWSSLLEGEGWKCVSNLPYNVGTPILSRLIASPAIDSLVVMLQKEVIDRIVAQPGERKRGSLSCWVQAFGAVDLICRVPPGAFYPPPKVDSAVVRIEKYSEPVVPFSASASWERFLRQLFAQPRKMVRNNIRDLIFLQEIEPELLKKRPFQLELNEAVSLFKQLDPSCFA